MSKRKEEYHLGVSKDLQYPFIDIKIMSAYFILLSAGNPIPGNLFVLYITEKLATLR
jgi:hypothetical protein